jgi:predicted ABC-class ATPase
MIRDDKMMQLVAPEKEPITPFIRIVRSLYNDNGISTIMVVGGVGDYLDVADNVVVMDCYHCLDVTERAKQIVATSQKSSTTLLPHVASNSVPFRSIPSRKLIGSVFHANGKVKVASAKTISYGETELDISGLEQLVSKSQTSAIANAIQQLPQLVSSQAPMRDFLDSLDQMINVKGLDCLAPGQFHGGMSRPRKYEIAGAINRLRREQHSIVQTK